MLRSAKRLSHKTTGCDGLQEVRKGKIADLKTRCPGLQERKTESEFRLAFTSDGVNYELVIALPESFPFNAPQLSVEPQASHPLLDEASTVIGIPDLTAYSVHTSLPDIVYSILSQFIVVPLHRLTKSQANPTGAMFMNGTTAPRTLSIFQEINSLSIEDLKEWSMNDLKVNDYVEKMPHIQARRQMLEQLSDTNECIAKVNLAAKEPLEKTRADLLSLCEQISEVRSEIEMKQEIFDLLAKRFEPEMMRERLKRIAHEAEEESEGIADGFLNKSLPVDDFLKSFARSRTLSHQRSAKSEALGRNLQQWRRSGY